jgi:hypothetical protein
MVNRVSIRDRRCSERIAPATNGALASPARSEDYHGDDTGFKYAVLAVVAFLTLAAMPARASLFSLAASGTITENSSGDSTIPVGTPWSFEIIYDTAAPDLDFESTGSPDPTFGRFTNTSSPPALTFFHYRAGSYEATLADAADFGTFSGIETTFTSINGIDINISAPALFPHLAGGPVSFHADFAAFSTPPIFSSDALPTNTAIGPGSFVDSNVTLLPAAGVVSGNNLASWTLTAILPGDYNQNGVVDAADYTLWRSTLGSTTDLRANGDDTGASAGVVDQADYTFWKSHFGQHSGSGAIANVAVPEPTTLMLGAIGVAVLLCRLEIADERAEF